ncbi:ammonium transporter [Fulvitalea axinellae]|uniref:Ammonium transporter n=1 Tax=Fulvitalea axinellae TaxID=1182444 RepID=A0AAU9CMY5_9BACT|nr:ammonium transporter [Fulvitalea axinellae]
MESISFLGHMALSLASTSLPTEAAGTASEIVENSGVLALTINNVWMMIAIAMVFVMHLGFACVEAGFTQAKNTVNILFKNTITPAVGILSYAVVGFMIMYPSEWIMEGIFGFGVGLQAPESNGSLNLAYNEGYTYWTDFLFQAMFAATTATIVSGAVAERIKLTSYMIFTAIYVSFIYPIIGSWHWGGGFLAELGFYDFAGSTLVHAVGGWGALAGVIVLGPRMGKYTEGKVKDFAGASVPLTVIGVFLLWFGWFGFNGGSVLSANPASTSLVLVTTSLAAAAGAIGAFAATSFMLHKLDLGMVLNGILAGLVGITAGADLMNPYEAIVIGLFAGVAVVAAAIFIDRKLKLDDCVGAISVHLVGGIIGTLAVGLLGDKAGLSQLLVQLTGTGVVAVAAFGSSFAIFKVMDALRGIRVSPEHEKVGLDSHEHGMRGYTIVFDE